MRDQPSNFNDGNNYLLRLFQTDFLYNQFLLQRVIVRKLEANTADTNALFRMSRTLLAEVLNLASELNRNQFGETSLKIGQFAADLPWMVCSLLNHEH